MYLLRIENAACGCGADIGVKLFCLFYAEFRHSYLHFAVIARNRSQPSIKQVNLSENLAKLLRLDRHLPSMVCLDCFCYIKNALCTNYNYTTLQMYDAQKVVRYILNTTTLQVDKLCTLHKENKGETIKVSTQVGKQVCSSTQPETFIPEVIAIDNSNQGVSLLHRSAASLLWVCTVFKFKTWYKLRFICKIKLTHFNIKFS